MDCIARARDRLSGLEGRVTRTQRSLERVTQLMGSWDAMPRFRRREGKREALLDLSDRDERIEKRFAEIETVGKEIAEIVQVIQFNKGMICVN